MDIGWETAASAVLLVEHSLKSRYNRIAQGTDLSGSGIAAENSCLIESGKQFLLKEVVEQGGLLRQRTDWMDVHCHAQFPLQLFMDVTSDFMKIAFRQEVCLAEQNDGGNCGFVEQAQRPYVLLVQRCPSVN
jgi:hypothetical protein